MTTIRHPVTGVEINPLTLIRRGKISDDEKRTARLLLADGVPRWIVAAMLGRFPLTFRGVGNKAKERKKPIGSHLATRDARSDERQYDMEDLFAALDSELGE